jgi:hypothetical protein
VRAKRALLKQLKVAEQPPEQNKDEDRRKASTAKLLRTVAGSEATQQLAHLRPPQRVVMRYQAGTAIGRWCTERTACRALVLMAVAVAGAACGGNASEERGQPRAPVVDSRAVGPTAASHASAKPLCPATGAWQLCSVVERLDRAGLAPRHEPGRVHEAPLSAPGVVILVGRSELRIFLYVDRMARERDQAKLDSTKYVMASEPLSMQAEPTLVASENLLAILRSRNDHQRERVSDALTAGPPQRPATKD